MDHDFVSDPAPLIEALRADAPVPKHLRKVLADLLERHRLVLRKGAKRIPSWRESDATARLIAANEEYRDLKLGSCDRDAAIEQLAKEYDIKPSTLHDYVTGKRGRRRRGQS